MYQNLKNNSVIVLFPGSYKPIHGGHLALIQRYSDDPIVKEIIILVGPGIRDGINQNKAVTIINTLTANIDKVIVEAVHWPSPILTAYKIVEEAEPGIYTLASSSKGKDYERIKDFIEKHNGGKFDRTNEGIEVIELPVSIEPLTYIGRNDQFEGKPISATILRNDIINDDFENFVTNYPNSDPEDIQFVWDQIATILLTESALSPYSTGPSTVSAGSNYSRTDMSSLYKSTFPIMEDDDEEVEDISEGGAAGHMMSPWEYYELTFGDMKELIEKALGGTLENLEEKLDGANIMITFKDQEIYLARTQKQMRNKGELATRWDKAYDYFGALTPERIKTAYKTALTDLQNLFEHIDLDLEQIFKNGTRWLNIELINPDTENIIPYMEFQLRIHNMREVNKDGKEIDVILEGGDLDKILREIKRIQEKGDLDNIHYIDKTNRVLFNYTEKLEKTKEELLLDLDNLMTEIHLDSDNNIGDYLTEEIRIITKEFVEDEELIESLLQRWVWNSKEHSITSLLKGVDESIVKEVKKIDSNINEIIGELLDPLIILFSKLGIVILKNLKGIASSNPELVSNKMKNKTEDAIQKIEAFSKNPNVLEQESFDKKLKYLEKQLKRLEKTGGLEAIAPIEGIVFEYKGQLFKLTGVYSPILQMINFFRFEKDK